MTRQIVVLFLLLNLSLYYCLSYFNSTYSWANYYIDINPDSPTLRQDLSRLLSTTHEVISYPAIWNAFILTDMRAGCINDIYSVKCWAPQIDQCSGSVGREHICYNREHSFPRSWWGGSTQIGAYTDLMHVFPADGYNNIKRSNNPIDFVDEPLHYRMSNGGKIGPCRNFKPLRCFEPTDSVKGDFARAYFYMSVRYWNEFKCCDMLGTNGARIKPMLEKVLREWNRIDPVSAFERQRNDAAFSVQKNRNPFIDHPIFVDRITSFSE